MNDFQNLLIDKLPDIAKVTFKRIHKDYLKEILIHIFVIFIVAFIGIFILVEYELEETIPGYIIYIYLLYAVVFISTLVLFIVGFSKRKYALREKDISYKSGVIVKGITTVPFSRIQHVEVNEGPISRLFKLASISVFTAGDSSYDLEIRGIKKTEALKIKEFVSKKING